MYSNTDYLGTIIKEKLKDFKLLQFFEAGHAHSPFRAALPTNDGSCRRQQ